MSEASHSFFHLNLNPPKNVPLKRCQPHFTGSFHDCPPVLTHLKGQPWDTAVVDVIAKTSWRKKSSALFSEALGKVSLDIITRNQGWVLSPGGQYESIASQGCGNEIGVLGSDVRRIESRTWT